MHKRRGPRGPGPGRARGPGVAENHNNTLTLIPTAIAMPPRPPHVDAAGSPLGLDLSSVSAPRRRASTEAALPSRTPSPGGRS